MAQTNAQTPPVQNSHVPKFNTSDEAKNFAVAKTTRYRNPAELERWIDYCRDQTSKAPPETQSTWLNELQESETWRDSDDFKNGDFPQGVDDLMLDQIEWCAMVYAFNNVASETKLFGYIFFQQWFVGAAYAVFSILGKLTNKDRRDNSIRHLWAAVGDWIQRDGACTAAEAAEIDMYFSPAGQLTNLNSKAFLFRNTVIAHNEKNLQISWSELDKEMAVLVRIWSLIVSWSSLGLFAPLRNQDDVFKGLEALFTAQELNLLKSKRKTYLDIAISWCRLQLHDGASDPGRTAFSSINIDVRATSGAQ